MSDMFSGDITNADSLQMSEIFGFMNPEYHETVVKRALDSRDKVSKEARGSLNSAINSTVKVPQFPKEPARAPTPYLMEQILKAVTILDKLTGAVLKVWAESHDALGTVVVKHLEDLAMPAEYPDFSGNRFRGTWFSDVWEREIDKILERHGEFDKDDVALMLCYVSGKIPGYRETKDNILSQGIEYLRSLPPNAPEWEQEIPEFIESLNAIRKRKEKQRSQAAELDATIVDIGNVFVAELAFFQRDITSWSVAQLSPDVDILEVLQLTKDLQSLLTEYQSVYGMAPVFSEEQIRRQKRAELEPRILPMMDRIDRLMGENQGPDDDSPSGVDVVDDFDDSTEHTEVRSSSGESEAQQPTGEVVEPPEALDEDMKFEKENERAFSDEDYTSLLSDNQHLNIEIESLHNKLYTSEKEAEIWRVAYIEEASKGAIIAGEDEDWSIESVHDAVARAKERFDDKLIFQLNGKSRVEANPFIHPKAVWDALQWLATTYYESRIGKISLTNPDVSIREACKWRYKRRQSDITMKKYKSWYTTKVGNKIHWLKEHIGTGISKDARYTIRIAFEWDKSKERVVIGFIGQHQQTDAT
ncbi:MAG: hypothetical protein F4Z86_04485 [Gemmatimonadetes bacterium]|nr:hypothetical protein [Gemmatimonadota bacterium]MYB55149.1 hypothetical protein [Gemmatimonadota bacterium]